MLNVYIIRDGKGGSVTSEIGLPEIAHLIDQGKIKYTGKKLKQSKGEVRTERYYIRINGTPRTQEVCAKPCCEYIRKEEGNDGTEVQDASGRSGSGGVRSPEPD